MKTTLVIVGTLVLTIVAQAQTKIEAPAKDTVTTSSQVDDQATNQPFLQPDWLAHEAIHAGNLRLIDGDAASALEAYRVASDLEPEAPQIPFVQGLAQYAQQDYEAARRSFERASTAEDVQLANDALYSLGTTYHAQALQQTQEDPKAAIASLEQALQQYRMVLDQNPTHPQAYDANRKAAAMRRQLREMLQQQEQQESESDDSQDKENEDQQDQDKQKSDSEQQDKSDQEEKQQQDSSEDSEKQQSDQQDESSKEEQKKEQHSEASPDDEQKEEKQQASAKPQEESETSKQAKRQLREMMQAMRDRKKERQQPVQRVPTKPVEKDW